VFEQHPGAAARKGRMPRGAAIFTCPLLTVATLEPFVFATRPVFSVEFRMKKIFDGLGCAGAGNDSIGS